MAERSYFYRKSPSEGATSLRKWLGGTVWWERRCPQGAYHFCPHGHTPGSKPAVNPLTSSSSARVPKALSGLHMGSLIGLQIPHIPTTPHPVPIAETMTTRGVKALYLGGESIRFMYYCSVWTGGALLISQVQIESVRGHPLTKVQPSWSPQKTLPCLLIKTLKCKCINQKWCVPVLIMTYPVFLKIKTFNNLNMWVQTIFHSFMALKPSVIPKKKWKLMRYF